METIKKLLAAIGIEDWMTMRELTDEEVEELARLHEEKEDARHDFEIGEF